MILWFYESHEWLQMTLPHLTTKAFRAYLLTKTTEFPVPISQFPVVLLSGNAAEVQGFVVLLLQWKQAKDGPRTQRMSYSEAWKYWVKLTLQPIYQLGELPPCSQTWSKRNNRGTVKSKAFCSKVVAVSTLPASEIVLHCNWEVL